MKNGDSWFFEHVITILGAVVLILVVVVVLVLPVGLLPSFLDSLEARKIFVALLVVLISAVQVAGFNLLFLFGLPPFGLLFALSWPLRKIGEERQPRTVAARK